MSNRKKTILLVHTRNFILTTYYSRVFFPSCESTSQRKPKDSLLSVNLGESEYLKVEQRSKVEE